ncbi:MAG: DNA topoisomerase IV subunit A [Micrococcaceae bacterium]
MESSQHVHDIDVAQEMEDSFLEYAYSVIYARALPDARDGLKPVQRRILYMMNQMGLTPDKGHVKSARVVGEVMGKLHPHGDGAIYDALVRMAQSFSLRLPLIDGHGNFGSLDDGPAASRYTEARLAAAALLMTQYLDENVVNFVPNYDNQLTQPEVLPAAYPNLLVNGASGIAVGMATNMAPHNLREVIAAAIYLIEHPDATTAQLMRYVPGPDLPTGGKIIGLDGVKEAYETGRGSFKTRAKAEITKISARKTGIIFTELPYLVGPEKIIEKVKSAVQNKKIQGISDIVDLTDRKNGTQLVVELKNGFKPEAVLAQLYKFTPLEESFGINNVALVDGQPRTLGLRELLDVYVNHRLKVVHRRTSFRFQKKKERLHLIDGLLLAMVDIDEVIEIVRSSDESAQAKERLQIAFDLSDVQASYILDLRLRQLTKFSRIELEKEREDLLAEIAALEEILNSDARLREVVVEELKEVAEQYGTPRRTILMASDKVEAESAVALDTKKAGTLDAEIKDEPCFVVLSATGLVARTQDRTIPTDPCGHRENNDVLRSMVPVTARGQVAAITNYGRMIRLDVLEFPVLPDVTHNISLAGGADINEYFDEETGEFVVGMVNLEDNDGGIALATAGGIVKRVAVGWPVKEDEWSAISLREKDEVVAALSLPTDTFELVFITEQAQLLHYPATKVRPQGRSGGGVVGIKLTEKDKVIFFGAVDPQNSAEVVTLAAPIPENKDRPFGSAKVSNFTDFPGKGRATAGVRAHRFLTSESHLNLAWAGHGPVLAALASGEATSLPNALEAVKRDASGTPLQEEVTFLGPNIGAEPTPEASQEEAVQKIGMSKQKLERAIKTKESAKNEASKVKKSKQTKTSKPRKKAIQADVQTLF